jgi:hypothetical protein
MKGQEETVEGPRMQNLNEEPVHKTAAMTQQGIQQDPQADPRAGDRETKSWDFQWVADNQGLGIVEGPPPSKTVGERLACLVAEGGGDDDENLN